MAEPLRDRDGTRGAALIALAALSLALLAVACFSLGWRIQHDAALMLYYAWLSNEQGFVLYRDFFEHQPPGAHLPYRLIGALSHYGDLGFRIFDLAYLAAIAAVSGALMRGYGRSVAWSASILFPLLYLIQGAELSLQRDTLLLLPVALALWTQVRLGGVSEPLRAGLAGLWLGLAFQVKPQVGLLFPVVLAFQLGGLWPERGSRARRRAGLLGVASAGVAGFLLPALAAAWALWRHETLWAFADTVWNYWPLFASLDGGHQTFEEGRRLRYLWSQASRFGGQGYWLAPALLGLQAALDASRAAPRERRLALLLAALLPAAVLFTAASGRFWHYHWLLFLYVASLLASLCWLPLPALRSAGARRLPAIAFAAAALLSLQPRSDLRKQLAGEEPHAPLKGRVDQIAAYLEQRLRPGDTVQPLDWTGGAIHAMLVARAVPATPFVTDFSFYHHISSPWVQRHRAQFLDALARARPRFVIQIETQKPWPQGQDTAMRFEALERLLARDYRLDLRGDGFRIYERAGLD